MNVAIYDPARGHALLGKEFYQGCTREEVREMAFMLQIEAIQNGTDLGSAVLVAWLDQPDRTFSIFTLGDELCLDETLLNSIEALTHARH